MQLLRRGAPGLVALLLFPGTAAASCSPTTAPSVCTPETPPSIPSMAAAHPRMPALFVNHGGGPLPVLNDPQHSTLSKHMRDHPKTFPQPRAIVVVTAHWEGKEVLVTTQPSHTLYYDYGGFPPESYEIQYPAPGHPQLGQKILDMLGKAGIPAAAETRRGLDHGVFIPLKLMYPSADVPVVAVSLQHSLDPDLHYRLGEAIAPLRDEGVLIVGSGFTFHNMQAFFGRGGDAKGKSKAFDSWLTSAVSEADPRVRKEQLSRWKQAPHATYCHPREEHLIPLFVIAGAGGADACKRIFHDDVIGVTASGYQYG